MKNIPFQYQKGTNNEEKLMQQVLCENCGPKVHFIADFSWTIFADKINLPPYIYDVTNLLNHR